MGMLPFLTYTGFLTEVSASAEQSEQTVTAILNTLARQVARWVTARE